MSRSPGNPETLTFDLWSWEIEFRKIFFSYVKTYNLNIWLRYSHSFPDSSLRSCSRSHPPLNMNIEGTIQSHAVTSLVALFYIICHQVFKPGVKLKVSWAKDEFWKIPKTVSIFEMWRSFKRKLKFKRVREIPVSHNNNIHIQIVDVSARVTLKFGRWPWKTIGHLFYATSSFGHHFKAIGGFKLELQSGNAQFGSKAAIFSPVWPWNLVDDLEKQ